STIDSSSASPSEAPQPVTQGSKLLQPLDTTVLQTRRQNTADATVEVQTYLLEPNIGRLEIRGVLETKESSLNV
ncbi:hypothetical protein ATANTOWER_008730, partial [Ataeniobius toweri]|nr:hypothetical protein [Ataeniobius toweri]